ncbi:MAG: Galactose-6-phosphate isomerase subunit LacA [Candidatus Woesearchaeota archaeon]|nr:Galactose-6-phosphate isomerase subunit LacA [Candidatus Woesearchaeota archaeon]
MTKLVAIGADHGGFRLKKELKDYLSQKDIPFVDLGNLKYDKKDDYPKYALKVAQYVQENNTKGILICKTGIGMCMAANKIDSIRAAVAHSVTDARKSRQHNDANILCLSSDTKPRMAKRIVGIWLKEKAKGGRHKRRVRQIRMMEQIQ